MENKSYHIIFHIDLNCFFASCHINEDKSLKGKPLVVCHSDPLKRGMVLTATYEARSTGIYTTMLLRDALPLCPTLSVVEPNYQLYQEYSGRFFKYLRSITHKVEPMSIDEGFLDMTDICPNNALEFAKGMQDYILNELGLPCSIGIGPNKFLAKMASDMKKPMGITILRKRDVQEKVWPLPIKALLGIGKKSQAKMDELGIKTIGDLATFPDKELLKKTFGPSSLEYFDSKLKGEGSTEVVWEPQDSTTLSNESTFIVSQTTIRVIKNELRSLAKEVSGRLKEQGKAAQTIGLKLKYETFESLIRSRSVQTPTNEYDDIYGIVEKIFDDLYDQETGVRLVGVVATRLVDESFKSKQLSIFDNFNDLEKENKVKNLINEINNTYGKDTINIGVNKNGKK